MQVTAGDLPELRDMAAQAHRRMWSSASGLTDADCRAASLLPGWTRGHVLTHWARNADGQSRMLLAALHGEIAAQYPGGDAQRVADIEAGAARCSEEILSDARAAVDRLEGVWRRMPLEVWSRPTGARSGERPAWMSVWARWRETEIHHVDLNAGYSYRDWPTAFVELMLPRVLPTLPGRVIEEFPVHAEVSDHHSADRYSADRYSAERDIAGRAAEDPVLVRGPAAAILCWLTGRPVAAYDIAVTRHGQACQLPELRPWA